jgi:hypothetical protein
MPWEEESSQNHLQIKIKLFISTIAKPYDPRNQNPKMNYKNEQFNRTYLLIKVSSELLF